MDYEQFLAIVDRHARIGRDAADRAVRAVLATLAERLTRARARQLATQLPPELLEPLSSGRSEPERLDLEAFLRRVADREGVDLADAEWHARAMFRALREVVSGAELDAVVAELPQDLAALVRDVPVMPVDELVDRVAAPTGLDREAARQAVEAVLETLAERIAPGDVDDLMSRLPVELHPVLKRGQAHNPGRAQAMPADEFLARVAQREGVDDDRVWEHTRAVFAVLAEAVEEEYFDVVVQLPEDYEALAHPVRG
jgi:uncharacterized protein (DUF2267 family)